MFRSVLICVVTFLMMCSENQSITSDKASIYYTTETYIYQDVAYDVLSTVTVGGEKTVVDNEDSRKVQSLLENPNIGVCPDPKNDSIVYLYLNQDEMKSVIAKIIGNRGLAKKKGTHSAILVGCLSLGCPDGNSHGSWTAGTDGCIASPWNNALSAMYWIAGDDGLDHAACYEKCGTDKGRSIVIWCATATEYNLRNYCMRKCLWWCCTTWDDQISWIDVWDY